MTARLPRSVLRDASVLATAGSALDISWPADYLALVQEHNGVEGPVGNWNIVLTAAEDLVTTNDQVAEMWPGIVVIGSDGAEEHIAYDRETLDVLLVRSDGGGDSWIILGSTLAEAFGHFERDDVFENPKYHEDVTPTPAPWPDDWKQRVINRLRGPE